jgi:protoheme IX farnesyltransferase
METPALEVPDRDVTRAALTSSQRAARLVFDLVSLTKPRLASLVLCTLAGGMWLAPGRLSVSSWMSTLLGTALLVGAANALNCWIERDRDRLMPRTRNRPLPAGRIAPDVGLGFGVLLASTAVSILALGSNFLPLALGLLALVSYVVAYTPLKTRTAWALLLGTVPGALPPLMGWTAVTGRLDARGLLLFGLLVAWQIPHFLAIAMFRRNEYRAAGIQVFPVVYGEGATRVWMVVWAFLLLVLSLALVPLGLGGALYVSVAGVLGVSFLLLVIYGACVDGDRGWAWKVFRLSLVHLAALFAALLLSSGSHHPLPGTSATEVSGRHAPLPEPGPTGRATRSSPVPRGRDRRW